MTALGLDQNFLNGEKSWEIEYKGFHNFSVRNSAMHRRLRESNFDGLKSLGIEKKTKFEEKKKDLRCVKVVTFKEEKRLSNLKHWEMMCANLINLIRKWQYYEQKSFVLSDSQQQRVSASY